MKILIADDDRINCCLVEETLKAAGYEVVAFQNGSDAFNALQEQDAPQLAILDWMMPGMDGLDVCRNTRLCESKSHIYLILLTSKTSQEHLLEGFEAGADDYITKPFESRQLLARVRAGEKLVQLQIDLAREREQLTLLTRELAETNLLLECMSVTDTLTGLRNRRYLYDRLEQEWTTPDFEQSPLSCMMMDVDHFKKINDSYGHDVGDTVLKQVADILKHSIRNNDIISRHGGEEFVVICPNTNQQQTRELAEQIRACVETETVGLIPRHDQPITVSIGVVSRNKDITNPDKLLKLADEAMYSAKHDGRNCIRYAWDENANLATSESF